MNNSATRKRVLVFIYGPQAVGKMSVGIQLKKLLGYKLLYNHQTIDIAESLFDRNDVSFIKFLINLNMNVFKFFLKTEPAEGLIYTDVWVLNREYDIAVKNKIFELFYKAGWAVYLVELECSLTERIARNRGELRMQMKPSKRDVEITNEHLLRAEKIQVLNTRNIQGWKPPYSVAKYIYVNTEKQTEEETAAEIIKRLKL